MSKNKQRKLGVKLLGPNMLIDLYQVVWLIGNVDVAQENHNKDENHQLYYHNKKKGYAYI